MADDQLGPGGDDQSKRFKSRLGPPPSRRGGVGAPERHARREDTSLAPVRRMAEADVPGPVEPPVRPEPSHESPGASLAERPSASSPAPAPGGPLPGSPDVSTPPRGDASPPIDADEAGFDEPSGFGREAEPTLVNNDLSALRLALQQRRAARDALGGAGARRATESLASVRGSEGPGSATSASDAASPSPSAQTAVSTEAAPSAAAPAEGNPGVDDLVASGRDRGPVEAHGASPDGESGAAGPTGGASRAGTLVFDAASIRRALDELSDGDVGAEGDDASETAAPGGRDAGALGEPGEPLRLTGLIERSGPEGEPAAGPDVMPLPAPGGPARPAPESEGWSSDDASEQVALHASETVLLGSEVVGDADPGVALHTSETLLLSLDVASLVGAGDGQQDPEPREDQPADRVGALDAAPRSPADEGEPWEDGPADSRVGTLVLTSETFADVLTSPEPEQQGDDEGDARQQETSSTAAAQLLDEELPAGPVVMVAERTEMTPFGEEPDPEPQWDPVGGATVDELALAPERFWPDLHGAQDDRTSVEPLHPVEAPSEEPVPPAATSAFPAPTSPSMGETSPGFGIGEVDIEDLDPSLRGGAMTPTARMAHPEEDQFNRMTSPNLEAHWASRAREMDTHILAVEAADEPAWTSGEESAPELDAHEASKPARARRTSGAALPTRAQPQQVHGEMSPASLVASEATSFLRAMVLLGLLALLGAFAVPTVVSGSLTAPWKSITDVQSLSFLCAVFFGINLLVAALPMPLGVRAGLLTLASAAHLGFGAMLVRDAALRFSFHGHPALDELFAAGALPTTVALLAAVVLPAGLYARGRFTGSIAARVTVGIGLALALVVLLGWGALFSADGDMPLATLVAQATGSATLQGDRFASVALLIGALAVPLSGLAFLGPKRTGLVSLWALLWSSMLGVALVIEAVHVVHLEHWREALEPTKVAAFVFAGLLIAPVALGSLIGALGPGKGPEREP